MDVYIGSDRPLIKDLYDYVPENVAEKWKKLGVQLLRSNQTVDVIEADHFPDSTTCCKRVLDKWLEVEAHATWSQLIRALRSPSVKLDYFANHLEQMLLQQRFYGNV